MAHYKHHILHVICHVLLEFLAKKKICESVAVSISLFPTLACEQALPRELARRLFLHYQHGLIDYFVISKRFCLCSLSFTCNISSESVNIQYSFVFVHVCYARNSGKMEK